MLPPSSDLPETLRPLRFLVSLRKLRTTQRTFIRPPCDRRKRAGPALGFLFGLAPGGVYLADRVAAFAVRSYRTFSPLPAGQADIGGVFSVALSRARSSRTGGRYPPPCPMVFGLSSRSKSGACPAKPRELYRKSPEMIRRQNPFFRPEPLPFSVPSQRLGRRSIFFSSLRRHASATSSV